ncbi:hypothetical protein MNBD_BACTEROID01-2141 [hydrothermal vent metagenome]|uniref:Uncharacterized protein n=1 Tax=hydrothermal vent metagenome TaxID=652676 RepID=A0A3B0U1P5_9ZZZZ
MKKLKKTMLFVLALGVLIAGILVLIAFARAWGKTDIEFRVHINEQLIQESTFGEPPTFAIWIENPNTGGLQTIFVTKRAALGDWEGKADVPVALPQWFEVFKIENQSNNLPSYEKPAPLAVTGATPKPGYFTTRVRVTPGSKWNCWIEVNLAGDFNEYYQEYNPEEKTTDEYLTGQPALLYKAEIEAVAGNVVKPKLAGMSVLDTEGGSIVQPVKGITTAAGIFDEMSISVIQPKPRIIEWN